MAEVQPKVFKSEEFAAAIPVGCVAGMAALFVKAILQVTPNNGSQHGMMIPVNDMEVFLYIFDNYWNKFCTFAVAIRKERILIEKMKRYARLANGNVGNF